MARQLQIKAYLTLRSISCYKTAVCRGKVTTGKPKTQLNSVKCAGICMQRQRLTPLNGRRKHFRTETCGICVRFVVRHYKPQTQIPAASYRQSSNPACMQTDRQSTAGIVLGPTLGVHYFLTNNQKLRLHSSSIYKPLAEADSSFCALTYLSGMSPCQLVYNTFATLCCWR